MIKEQYYCRFLLRKKEEERKEKKKRKKTKRKKENENKTKRKPISDSVDKLSVWEKI